MQVELSEALQSLMREYAEAQRVAAEAFADCETKQRAYAARERTGDYSGTGLQEAGDALRFSVETQRRANALANRMIRQSMVDNNWPPDLIEKVGPRL